LLLTPAPSKVAIFVNSDTAAPHDRERDGRAAALAEAHAQIKQWLNP